MKVKALSHDRNHAPDPISEASALVKSACCDLARKLTHVRAQLDWSEPRIAFYGETNAGKSTAIEALRLLFGAGGDLAGTTIGDGQPDFTREATSYPCEYEGKRFTLVDVPGIEGAEQKVIEQIDAAVRSAHLVFYVTPNPRPPQGDEPGRLGTLGKIRQQLKPQAVVLAIYNKKVNTPDYLSDDLLTDDEQASLTDGAHSLDGKLGEALGQRYAGSSAISALPAFLALAESLTLDERLAKQQRKFLARMSAEHVLGASRLRMLGDDIAQRVPDEQTIAERNTAKLRMVVEEAAAQLERSGNELFGARAKTLNEACHKLENDLTSIADAAGKELRRISDQLSDRFSERVRKRVTTAIDSSIWRDATLRAHIDAVVRQELNRIQKIYEWQAGRTARAAELSCVQALTALQPDVARQAAPAAEEELSLSFKAAVKTRSGVEWKDLFALAAGATLGASAGGTGLLLWAMRANTARKVMGSLRKSVSPKFRRAQQSKSLEENLLLAAGEIRVKLDRMRHLNEEALRAGIVGISTSVRARQEQLTSGHAAVKRQVEAFRDLMADGDRLAVHIGGNGLDTRGRRGDAHVTP